MMKKSLVKSTLLFLALLFFIYIGVLLYKNSQHRQQNMMAFETYTNQMYGLTIQYPRDITPETSFKQYYHIPAAWCAEVSTESPGKAIVSIPVFRIDQAGVAIGKPYPLYFDAEVRIGESANPNEVANCLKPDPNYLRQPITDVTINGVVFRRFHMQSAAMMQYFEGESFRTVHNNICFAIEQIETGSHYRDPSMQSGIPDETLNNYYEAAGTIVQTIRFLK